MNKREKIEASFARYVPDEFVANLVDLLFSEKIHFKVVKPRRTKLGDYRPPYNGNPHRITINSNLNKYAFLITTLHEFAHLKTYNLYGNKIKAHGKEWQEEFRKLLAPLLVSQSIPDDLKEVLNKSIRNIKAASCTDMELYRVLKRYDENKEGFVLLENLEINERFQLGKRLFERGTLRTKRYLCKEVTTGRQFLVSRLAEVKPIMQEQNEK